MAVETLPSRVLVVAGPTASGKSELATALAEALGAEIVGADSRQIYRYMDVGTAKPPAELRARVRHHLIDVVDPDADYDVAAWRRDALSVLADIHARGHAAIVCGGTGLYLRSLEHGLFAGPPADVALRRSLEREEAQSPGTLHVRLARVDPPSAARIHANDLVRLIRALEVFESTGRPLSMWLAEHGLSERPFVTLTLEVEVAREELRERIEARSRAMVEAGLVEELASLHARGYAPATRAFQAIGYREAGLCLAGALPRRALAEAIGRATNQYAKRQRTWLRGQADTVKIAHGDAEAALRLARTFFS
ncbi:MAG: tRNA (adenosine(37)-N6)-dimethylallyltransferase MiaA [Deltaproteobacteria bacterium]|nr:tRNA (adenosine(37)-N6)-dimethylallyltransferase MiaA [Deltaproteobacteria bacterium]